MILRSGCAHQVRLFLFAPATCSVDMSLDAECWPTYSMVTAIICSCQRHLKKIFTSLPHRLGVAAVGIGYRDICQWLAFFTSRRTEPLSKRDIAVSRVRTLLYEQFVPHLFPTNRPCCFSIVDLEQLCEKRVR